MVYLFRKQDYKLCRLFCKSLGKKFEKHGLVPPFLICLAKEMQHIIFYAYVHTGSLSYTNEE